jgi:hypothetical protein
MNTFSTNNLPRDIALTQTKVTEEKQEGTVLGSVQRCC